MEQGLDWGPIVGWAIIIGFGYWVYQQDKTEKEKQRLWSMPERRLILKQYGKHDNNIDAISVYDAFNGREVLTVKQPVSRGLPYWDEAQWESDARDLIKFRLDPSMYQSSYVIDVHRPGRVANWTN